MKDRFQIIGASEIAGIVKEYSANLFAENLISETISQKLEAMPNYLETRYSLGKKLMLNREQFEKFQVNYNGEKKLIKTKDATQTAKVLNRGKSLEEAVKDNYFNLNRSYDEITESQTAKDKIIKNCKFLFRATIDYILDDDTILECKTTDITQWFKIENDGLPFNYYIQTQAQLWLHEKEICEVHIAGVKTVNKEHQILDSKTFKVGLDPKMVRALTASLVWFSSEFEKGTLFNKDEADKTKKDKQIDEFLALEKGTLELPIESNLSAKLARLKYLEEAKKEYEKLDKEIKEQVKQSMKDYKFARFKSNRFEIEAKYSNESYHDETSINEAIEKAKLMTVGDVKSVKKLTIKY
jgi:predicted phage-related endonuclease